MYLKPVERATRNDIAAAAAAHRELGDDYDEAVAEGLIERIGAEIDKRVDAKLGGSSRGSRAPAEVSPSGRHQELWTGLGVGAGVTGLIAMIANGNGSPYVLPWMIAIWVILAVAGLGTAVVHRYRNQGRG
jgi:hypothetical protein